MTQNRRMIEEVRIKTEPLVEALTLGKPPEEAKETAAEVLNQAVNIRRGLDCGRQALMACATCQYLQTDTLICEIPGLQIQGIRNTVRFATEYSTQSSVLQQ